jgi:hypothetical protein
MIAAAVTHAPPNARDAATFGVCPAALVVLIAAGSTQRRSQSSICCLVTISRISNLNHTIENLNLLLNACSVEQAKMQDSSSRHPFEQHALASHIDIYIS